MAHELTEQCPKRYQQYLYSGEELYTLFKAEQALAVGHMTATGLEFSNQNTGLVDAFVYDPRLNAETFIVQGQHRQAISIAGAITQPDFYRSLLTQYVLYAQQQQQWLPESLKIAIPVNVGNNHWITLALNFSEPQVDTYDQVSVHYVDSLLNSHQIALNTITAAVTAAFDGNDNFPTLATDTVQYVVPIHQQDGHSCGPVTAEQAKHFVRNGTMLAKDDLQLADWLKTIRDQHWRYIGAQVKAEHPGLLSSGDRRMLVMDQIESFAVDQGMNFQKSKNSKTDEEQAILSKENKPFEIIISRQNIWVKFKDGAATETDKLEAARDAVKAFIGRYGKVGVPCKIFGEDQTFCRMLYLEAKARGLTLDADSSKQYGTDSAIHKKHPLADDANHHENTVVPNLGR